MDKGEEEKNLRQGFCKAAAPPSWELAGSCPWCCRLPGGGVSSQAKVGLGGGESSLSTHILSGASASKAELVCPYHLSVPPPLLGREDRDQMNIWGDPLSPRAKVCLGQS